MCFYFDFRDTEKAVPDDLVRSFVHQLIDKIPGALEEVEDLKKAITSPTNSQRLELLGKIVGLSQTPVWAVIDGLDEGTSYPQYNKYFRAFTSWNNLRFFTASRPEHDIVSLMSTLDVSTVDIELYLQEVSASIQSYTRSQLEEHPILNCFSEEFKDDLEEKLVQKSAGMWVS